MRFKPTIRKNNDIQKLKLLDPHWGGSLSQTYMYVYVCMPWSCTRNATHVQHVAATTLSPGTRDPTGGGAADVLRRKTRFPVANPRGHEELAMNDPYWSETLINYMRSSLTGDIWHVMMALMEGVAVLGPGFQAHHTCLWESIANSFYDIIQLAHSHVYENRCKFIWDVCYSFGSHPDRAVIPA